MLALHDVSAGTEEQEGTSPIRALRIALQETFVADHRSLLVTGKPGDLDALERAVCDLAVHLGGGDDFREHGRLELEEAEEDGVPLERVEVHEQCARRVRDLSDVQVVLRPAGQALHEVMRKA